MEENKIEIKEEKKEAVKPVQEAKEKIKQENKEEKAEAKPVEAKQDKNEEKKKDFAVARGKDLPISTKQAIDICKFIRGKKIEEAVSFLEKVRRKETALPMKGEIPHRKNVKRKTGRWPEKSSGVFIMLLKSLAANCNVKNIDNAFIEIAKADIAARPYRRGGSQRFKRTHVYLQAKGTESKEEKK